MLEMRHDHVAMLLQYGQGDEDVKVAAEIVGPETLPQSKNISPFKLALVPDKQHAEEEKEIGGVG